MVFGPLTSGTTGAVHDTNPSLGLKEDGISSIMGALRTIRERALSKFDTFCLMFLWTSLSKRSLSHLYLRTARGACEAARNQECFSAIILSRYHGTFPSDHPIGPNHCYSSHISRKCNTWPGQHLSRYWWKGPISSPLEASHPCCRPPT